MSNTKKVSKSKITSKGANLVANFMKNKAKLPPKAPVVDAEDLKDGGVDEAKELS